jgi:hypothetical protein
VRIRRFNATVVVSLTLASTIVAQTLAVAVENTGYQKVSG